MKRRTQKRTRIIAAVGAGLGPFEVDTTMWTWSHARVKCVCGGREFRVHRKGLTCRRGMCSRQYLYVRQTRS